MSRIVLIEPENDTRWDQFIEQHPNGRIYHSSGWKKVLEKCFGHMKGFYPALIDETGLIRAALPVFAVRSRIMGNRLVSIPFATTCDPLVETAEQLEALLQKVFDLASAIDIKKLQIKTLNCGLLCSDDRFWKHDFYKHHFILLDKEPEKLARSFHRTNVRQRIKRALNSNILVKQAEDESEMADFFRLHAITRKKVGLPPQPYSLFKCLWDTFSPSGRIVLLLARKNNETLAGLILFRFRDRVSAEFLAWDDQFVNLSPNHKLFWDAIQDSYNEGYKVFDFGRTAVSSKSLMTFKSRWGTTVVDLPQYFYPRKAYEGYLDRENTLAFWLINKAVTNLPENVCKVIGSFLYQHLG